MPWLTTYGATNKITIESTPWREEQTVLLVSYTRDNLVEKYKYVGMDEATATTCAAALHNPGAGVFAAKKREGNGGNYMVEVTETTYGTWA